MNSLNTNDWYPDCFVYQTQNSAGLSGGKGGGSNDRGTSKINAGVIAAVVGIGAIAVLTMLLRRRRVERNKARPDLLDEPVTRQGDRKSVV